MSCACENAYFLSQINFTEIVVTLYMNWTKYPTRKFLTSK